MRYGQRKLWALRSRCEFLRCPGEFMDDRMPRYLVETAESRLIPEPPPEERSAEGRDGEHVISPEERGWDCGWWCRDGEWWLLL